MMVPGDDTTPQDARQDTVTAFDMGPPLDGLMPAEPAPPTFQSWTCRPGWVPETRLAGTPQEFTICAPPPLPTNCATGTMAVLGEATCQPIGAACPSGDFPVGLPAGATVIYVKAGGNGGNGSMSSPYGDLANALGRAPTGAIIAIAKGTYTLLSAELNPSKAVTLWGACAAQTKLVSSPSGVLGIYSAITVTAKNLTLTGDGIGVSLLYGGGVILDGVVLSSLLYFGIQVGAFPDDACKATLNNVAVIGTRAGPDVPGNGIGMQVGPQAQVQITRSIFDGNHGAAIEAYGNPAPPTTTITLTDVILRNTTSSINASGLPAGGFGIEAIGGTEVHGSGLLVENNTYTGISVEGYDASQPIDSQVTLSLEDVVVRNNGNPDLDPNTAGLDMAGLGAAFQASVTVNRGRFEGNYVRGILSNRGVTTGTTPSVGGSLNLQNIVVTGTLSSNVSPQAAGLLTDTTPTTVSGALFEGNHYAAVASLRRPNAVPGVKTTLTDVVIADTVPAVFSDGTRFASALQSSSGDMVERAIILNHQLEAVVLFDWLVAGPMPTLDLTDVLIDNLGVPGTGPTLGLNAVGMVKATATRMVVRGCRGGGVNGSSFPDDRGTPLIALTDVLVEQTTDADDGEFGDGVYIQQGAVSMTRARIRSSSRSGVLAFGATAALTDSVLECNPIQLDQELFSGQAGRFQSLGGNVCGCSTQIQTCQAVSASLQAPNSQPTPPPAPSPE
jgi:hypothetical protein